MIIGTGLVLAGLIASAWIATTRGYRLGGVVVVSLVAVYGLVSFLSLPVFLLSTVVTFAIVELVHRQWLIYGRRLFLVAVGIGMVLPVAAFLAIAATFGDAAVITELEFLGSVLPGIAAYNFHREDADRRLRDALVALAMLLALLVAGALAAWLWITPPCLTCSVFPRAPSTYVAPLVLGGGSDLAEQFGAGSASPTPLLGDLGTVTVVVLVGLALSEIVRSRLGLQPLGIIVLPLVALFSLRVWWALPLYVGIGLCSWMAVEGIHRRTLLYGRALFSLATGLGVLLALGAMVGFGLTEPLVVFFTGLFGGIGAYHLHLSAPRERADVLFINGASFAIVFGLARLLMRPFPSGLGQSITPPYLLVGAVLCLGAARVVYEHEQVRPSLAAIERAAPFDLGRNQ